MTTRTDIKYKGAMFDLDGTLLNTIDDLADSVNAALDRSGLPTHQLKHYLTAVGDGAETMVSRSLPENRRDQETIQQVFSLTREEYGRRWNNKTRPYEGIPKMLDALCDAGITVCILSNKPHNATLMVVAEFLPDWDFTIVRGARDGVPIKPNPQSALEIARECSIEAKDWLYAGDTDTDMQTAKAAGFFAVGVAWGFRSVQELRDHGADIVVERPSQIPNLILSP